MMPMAMIAAMSSKVIAPPIFRMFISLLGGVRFVTPFVTQNAFRLRNDDSREAGDLG